MEQIKAGKLTALGVGGAINAAFYGEYAIILQSGSYPTLNPRHNGRLLVLRPGTEDAALAGQLENLGSARQLTIAGNIAYVTSREDGLYIIDLSAPERPHLLSRYETTEFATGVSVAEGLLAVSLRQYGVELVDVRDPRKPRFISLIRTGEAQSVWLDGKTVYAGVWGSKELVIADISAPEAPRLLTRVPLDGRGDGVIVRDGVCFAATGHHARPPRGVENPSPESYEALGNGLEIFDVRDPARPMRLGGVKFPPYYGLTFDMWSVRLSGETALVSDSRNGLFFVDISDLRAPRITGRLQLPPAPDGRPDPIGGFDFQGDLLALAGGETDAYLCRLSRALSPSPRARLSFPAAAAPRQAMRLAFAPGEALPWKRALAQYNVLAVTGDADTLFAACGEAGTLALEKGTLRRLQRLPVDAPGAARAVLWQAPFLYVAEGLAGLAAYEREGGRFVRRAALGYRGRAINDLQLSGNGRFLLAQCAGLGVIAYALDPPGRPRFINAHLDFVGLFYGRHFPARGLGSDCFLGCNRDGVFRVSCAPEGTRLEALPRPQARYSFSSSSGLEIWNNRLLAVTGKGNYFIVPETEFRAFTGAEACAGKPRRCGDWMVITERAEGLITLCDASAFPTLKVIARAKTTASPDLAWTDGESIFIPGGRQGLILLKAPRKKEET